MQGSGRRVHALGAGVRWLGAAAHSGRAARSASHSPLSTGAPAHWREGDRRAPAASPQAAEQLPQQPQRGASLGSRVHSSLATAAAYQWSSARADVVCVASIAAGVETCGRDGRDHHLCRVAAQSCSSLPFRSPRTRAAHTHGHAASCGRAPPAPHSTGRPPFGSPSRAAGALRTVHTRSSRPPASSTK